MREFKELQTEIDYTHLFDVHPGSAADRVDIESFDAYMERWAGPEWRDDFQVFAAALVFAATRTLCSEHLIYVESLFAAGIRTERPTPPSSSR